MMPSSDGDPASVCRCADKRHFPDELPSPAEASSTDSAPLQLLNKDFYHLSAGTLEVKSNTPNNVAFKVTGKSSHDNATSGTVRANKPGPGVRLGRRPC